MNFRRFLLKTIATILLCGSVFSTIAAAGSLEPSAPPGPTMKTLNELPPAWSLQLRADDGDGDGEGCGSSRFECVLGGSGVLDKETGLVWERRPKTRLSTFAEAKSTCESRSTGGRMGWRVPSFYELSSLAARIIPLTLTGHFYFGLPRGNPFMDVNGELGYWTSSVRYRTEESPNQSQSNPLDPFDVEYDSLTDVLIFNFGSGETEIFPTWFWEITVVPSVHPLIPDEYEYEKIFREQPTWCVRAW